MYKKAKIVIVFIIFCFTTIFLQAEETQKGFPQNLVTDTSHITKPAGSLESLNSAVAEYYEKWKYGETRMDDFLGEERRFPGYLREMEHIEGGFFVKMIGNGDAGTPAMKSTSEAMGYGLLISALMADGSADSKGRTSREIFDGLYSVVNAFPSTDNDGKVITPYLMSWIVPMSEEVSDSRWNATDGDLDIAYALLLAHDQWGSEGRFNYKEEALKRIDALKNYNVDSRYNPPRLNTGNWFDDGTFNSCLENHTRPSDWMVGHTTAFYHATGDVIWHEVTEGIYSMTAELQANYAAETGLVPDFVYNDPGTPVRPTNPETEGPHEGGVEVDQYSWNACRFPWRQAQGYVQYGDERAKANLTKLLDWLFYVKEDVDTESIRAGYSLDGDDLVEYGGHAFSAPFMLAATVDAKYQSYIDTLWSEVSVMFESDWPDWVYWSAGGDLEEYQRLMKEDGYSGYFSDSINMLCLIAATGNWWEPGMTDWNENRVWYEAGEVVFYNGAVYVNTYNHWSQVDYYPGAPGLWFWQKQ